MRGIVTGQHKETKAQKRAHVDDDGEPSYIYECSSCRTVHKQNPCICEKTGKNKKMAPSTHTNPGTVILLKNIEKSAECPRFDMGAVSTWWIDPKRIHEAQLRHGYHVANCEVESRTTLAVRYIGNKATRTIMANPHMREKFIAEMV
jgi:hypothetical protein